MPGNWMAVLMNSTNAMKLAQASSLLSGCNLLSSGNLSKFPLAHCETQASSSRKSKVFGSSQPSFKKFDKASKSLLKELRDRRFYKSKGQKRKLAREATMRRLKREQRKLMG